MTAEEVRYHGDVFGPAPVRQRSGEGQGRGSARGEGGQRDAAFERYFEGRTGAPSGRRTVPYADDAYAHGARGAAPRTVESLTAQVREMKAKLAERTNELEAAKSRNKLMEEHIESVGADREDIVKVNVSSLAYAAVLVVFVLCLAAAAAWAFEPVGLPAARALARRWGKACDGTCAADAAAAALGATGRGGLFATFTRR